MKRILLIEPNSVLAKVYKQMLEKLGYEVAHVTTAQAGINAADKASPDLVILELQIPKHSGIEFLHEFCSYPEWQTVPVIINTVITPNRLALVQESLKRDMGVVAVLYKPKTSLDMLAKTIKESL